MLYGALLLIATLLAFGGQVDGIGSDALDEALKRALLAFAIARGLNGVISVAQGTELAVQPAGLGLNFSPGEILDPVNDVVEAFSWVMLAASSALGMQKVLLAMSDWVWLAVLLLLSGLAFLYLLWRHPLRRRSHVAGRIFLFILFLRFLMPAVAIANHWVYTEFLAADEQYASDSLQQARERISKLNSEWSGQPFEDKSASPTSPGSVIERARELFDQLGGGGIEARLDSYRQAADHISENTVRLIVVFVLQSVVFPLLFLWVVVSLARRLFAFSLG